MCGIFGVISNDAALETLEGLRRLEYRGYDSSGIAAIFDTSDGLEKVTTERSVGYVSDLANKIDDRFKGSKIAIGHTRWATHGGVTEVNAHPHTSNDQLMSVVHNGIIENTDVLVQEIEDSGYVLRSETDTEVIIHLLHKELGEDRCPIRALESLQNVVQRLEGAWALAVIMSGLDGILIAKNGAPLILGRSDDSLCVSSDPMPLYGKSSEIAYLDDGDIGYVSMNSMDIITRSAELEFKPHQGQYIPEDPGIFGHMMLKEIYDQPTSLQNAITGRISADGKVASLSGFKLKPEQIRKLDRINLVACGTAYFSAKIGVEYIRRFSNIPTEAYLSSEFPADHVCGPNTLTIGITQSGETKDTYDALNSAKIEGSHISSICNVIDSTIARFTGNGAYLYAGPEYSVASTKAFTNMTAVLLVLGLMLDENGGSEKINIIKSFRKTPNKMSNFLHSNFELDNVVEYLKQSKFAIFMGRGINYHIACEASLKMMELTYMPCLAYPGGELKHGPLALIEDGTPVIAIAPNDTHYHRMEANLRECASRGASVILVTDKENPACDYCKEIIKIPQNHQLLTPFLTVMPMHLLAYKLALSLNRNVDRPRNLAKSVTVV